MAHAGYFKVEELKTLRKFGTKLQGHPHREYLRDLETSSGPLGEGLSQAVGMAIAEKINNKDSDKNFFCIMSDGELDEGQTWEAILLANKYKLGNLIAILDRNNIQISGFTEEIMPLNNLVHKFLSFNWDVHEVDGDNFREINNAIEKSKEKKDKPSIIIAHTIPGCGIKIFENNYHWHGSVPNKEQAVEALKELEELEASF
jgi:transketolase